MKINVQGFASDFVATFPSAQAAHAFTGAMLDNGGPITERETRALASSFGGDVVTVISEAEALALDLADAADMARDTAEALDVLHALCAGTI